MCSSDLDEAVLAALYALATKGTGFPETMRHLPPRVSPARVAVRALHDHLVGVPEAPRDPARLFAALCAERQSCAAPRLDDSSAV